MSALIFAKKRVETELQRSVRALARGHLIRRKSAEIPTSQELLIAAIALLAHSSSASKQYRINYDEYCTAKATCSPRIQAMLTCMAFAKMPRDAADEVPTIAVIRYLWTRSLLLHTFCRLSIYDTVGDGRLREHDVENFVFEAIPSVPELAALQENFYPFYVFTAVRKFFFFLDQNHRGGIAINDILASKVFAEWLRLLPPDHPDAGPAGVDFMAVELEVPPECPVVYGESQLQYAARQALGSMHPPPSAAPNWFSASNALRVYSQYLQLDRDQNGMLSEDELAGFSGGSYTRAFISRVFQECHTYSGEMDYKSFLDFLLATEYRTSPASLRYMFRLVDMRHKGALTLFEMRFFLRQIAEKLVAAGGEPIDIDNLNDEVFDMVSPADPTQLTLTDLLKCKLGHSVLHLMTDVNGLLKHENREAALAQNQGAPVQEESFG